MYRLSALILFFTVFLSAEAVSLDDIKASLICHCGCSMTVDACEGAMTCGTATDLTNEARTYINQGLSKDEILSAFVSRYGETILSAPTKSGFNLVAWVMPFLVLGLVGAGIISLIRKWAGQITAPVATAALTSEPQHVIDDYEQQLDDVLRNID